VRKKARQDSGTDEALLGPAGSVWRLDVFVELIFGFVYTPRACEFICAWSHGAGSFPLVSSLRHSRGMFARPISSTYFSSAASV